MNTIRRFGFAVFFLTLGCSFAHAQSTAFTYQGRLNDGGNPANGIYDLQFAVYDMATLGTLIAGPVTNTAISVTNGLFTTTVDFGGGIFDGEDLWLEIAASTNGANAFATVTPRQEFTQTPYALYAQTAGAANTIGSGTVSAPQLNTGGAPAAGQVLAYNGAQLVWQNPVVGTNTGGWSLTGNLGTTAGVNFLGTSDSQPLELKVGGVRGLRLEPNASGYPNVIGGSPSNFASNGVVGAAIGGGINNIAGGAQSAIGGGYQNYAFGYIASIAGGAYNQANGNEAFVGGGAYNVSSNYGTIGGGYGNIALGYGSFIGGGGFDGSSVLANTASGPCTFVGGGLGNSASGYEAVAGGGYANLSSGTDSFLYFAGGVHFASGGSTVGGGLNNTASATGSTVPGGMFNIASGDMSLAAGFHASAATSGSFVWSDASSSTSFTSVSNNQFVVRATGGVGIGTAQTPPGGLRVAGGGLAVTGASSPNYPGSAGVFIEKTAAAGAMFAFDYNAVTPLPLALNSPGGNVGIGTLSPQYTLDVNGTTRTHSIIITGGADVAEPFKTGSAELPKGSVVVIDREHPGELKLSSRAYDKTVAGIVSGANGINPGIALHQEGALEGGQNVALSGRVYVQADASNGVIEPGDLLTTSDVPGHAMKVTDHTRAQGAIIGKAMSGLNKGSGMVLVLVSLQ